MKRPFFFLAPWTRRSRPRFMLSRDGRMRYRTNRAS